MSMANLARRLAPLGNRVLVQKALAETVTAGGIMLPETAQKTLPQGEVIAVGPGALTMDGSIAPMSLTVGNKVFLPEFGGTKLPTADDEPELLLFREEDILAIVSDA